MHPKDANGMTNDIGPTLFAQTCVSKNFRVIIVLKIEWCYGYTSSSSFGIMALPQLPWSNLGVTVSKNLR